MAAVKKNQPSIEALPSLEAIDAIRFDNAQEKFKIVLEGIGGVLINADNLQQVAAYVQHHFKEGNKYITSIPELEGIEKLNSVELEHRLDAFVVIDDEHGRLALFGFAEDIAIQRVQIGRASCRERV